MEKYVKEFPEYNLNRYFDGSNDNDYNLRVTNIINQLRYENNGFYQTLKLTLIK